MDIRMPGLDGLAATRELLGGSDPAGCKVVILTTFDVDEHVYEALRAGASGFLLKDVPADQLAHAIRVAAAGEALLAPSVTRRLISAFNRRMPGNGLRAPAPTGLDELTARELEVLTLLAEGLSNAEIAPAAVRRGGHGQDPRGPGAHEARRPRPGPGGHRRVPRRPGAAGLL